MNNPRCDTCRAYNALETTCQRNAPTPMPEQVSPNQIKIHGIFPGTHASRWCLQHVPMPEEAVDPAPVIGTSSCAVR